MSHPKRVTKDNRKNPEYTEWTRDPTETQWLVNGQPKKHVTSMNSKLAPMILSWAQV